MEILELRPVGVVEGGREGVHEDGWGAVQATIVLDPEVVGPDATVGLEEFSHIEVIFVFHQTAEVRLGTAHPRGNARWPEVGILANHSPKRPNHLGVSRCDLLAVDGLTLRVRGLDALDGSPVLDVKPWFAEFGPHGPVRQPPWTSELMGAYW
ncbi:MAG TPA: TrmO family methyltransferase [Nocardioidaceae bacterium]|nr:TrmO family methyltransferase [Nocardioidaceae bacterium]